MTRHIPIRLLAVLALLCTLTGAAIGATLHSSYLPVVQSAPVATRCDASAPLLDQDTGLISAGQTSDGRYIVAYQDRAHGSRAHVAQHVGDHLVEVADVPASTVFGDPGPQFSPPGPKQGALALVMGLPGQRNRLYYTQRKEDDTPSEGAYGVWCLEF